MHKKVTVILIYICITYCDNKNRMYKGDQFPDKYLDVAKSEMNFDDVNLYLNSMVNIFGYFSKKPNNTNINSGFGYYFSKGKCFKCSRTLGSRLTQPSLARRTLGVFAPSLAIACSYTTNLLIICSIDCELQFNFSRDYFTVPIPEYELTSYPS